MGIDVGGLVAELPIRFVPAWTTWHGHVPTAAAAAAAHRLVVREYEYAETDETLPVPFIGDIQVLGNRVVYADTVRL